MKEILSDWQVLVGMCCLALLNILLMVEVEYSRFLKCILSCWSWGSMLVGSLVSLMCLRASVYMMAFLVLVG